MSKSDNSNSGSVTLPIRLRHLIDTEHLVRAIGTLDDADRESFLTEIFDAYGDDAGFVKDDQPDTGTVWYNKLCDDDKRKFLSSIGVRQVNLSPVKMTKSFPVNSRTSSSINRIAYNPDECRIEVTFLRDDGKEQSYQYAFVPPRIFEEFIASPSIGKYYNDNIKKQHQSLKL